jgi:hypothetical protein
MEDAITCVRSGVLRPALVMLGLATETTIKTAHAALVHQNAFAARHPLAKARDLMDDIDAWVKALPAPQKDKQHRLAMALSTVETIRVERNNAAHPGHTITDRLNIEALLTNGAHHIPVFWDLVITPALGAGFAL